MGKEEGKKGTRIAPTLLWNLTCLIFPSLRGSKTNKQINKLSVFSFPDSLTILWPKSFLFDFILPPFAGFLRLTFVMSPVQSPLPPIAESPVSCFG